MGNFNVPQRFATKIGDTRWWPLVVWVVGLWMFTTHLGNLGIYSPEILVLVITQLHTHLSWPLGVHLPAWHDQLPSQGATCHEHSHCSIMIMIYQWSLNDFILPLVIYY
jgi:hypothetical protein